MSKRMLLRKLNTNLSQLQTTRIWESIGITSSNNRGMKVHFRQLLLQLLRDISSTAIPFFLNVFLLWVFAPDVSRDVRAWCLFLITRIPLSAFVWTSLYQLLGLFNLSAVHRERCIIQNNAISSGVQIKYFLALRFLFFLLWWFAELSDNNTAPYIIWPE